MSGHSKWSQIKRQKGTADVKRASLYTKLAKAISIAVREGGGKDPGMNVRLRLALEKARSANMPSATMERAIKRGAGELGGEQIERVVYEGYGPGGVALLIEAMTDNKNRTTAEVRHALDAAGGSLGTTGSVQWMFELMGVLDVAADHGEEAELALIDAGAKDVQAMEGGYRVLTDADGLDDVRARISAQGRTIQSAGLHLLPKNSVAADAAVRQQIAELVETLEESDDVANVTTNVAA